MRRVTDRLRSDDQGAYMAVIGALFFTLLVVMVLAIDTGMVYQERHELQNGADAGAIAVAFNCARGGPCNPEDAEALANANATTDGIADVESVDIDDSAGEVTVTTRSEAEDGEFSLYLMAARVFGMESTTVRAQATAAWGAVGSASTIPFTISFCDLDVALDDQGGYVDIPPPPGPGAIITFHDTSASGGDDLECDGHPGFDMYDDEVLPGGFGKLEIDENCQVTTYTDEDDDVWATVKEGVSVPPAWQCMQLNTVTTIPIFVDFRLLPSQKEYRIGGYAAFYLTGYRMPGYSANPPCGGSQTCISGWFTENTISDGEFGDVDFGVRTARLTR